MIRVIISDDFEISGIIDIVFLLRNILCGPYISCQFLSFMDDRFIKGEYRVIIFVDMKWINHREIDDCPIDLNVVLLNDIKSPNIIPVNIISNIIILKLLGKIIICSGLIIHRISAPKKIGVGVINIMGMFEKLLVWLLRSGLSFINILFDENIIRSE